MACKSIHTSPRLWKSCSSSRSSSLFMPVFSCSTFGNGLPDAARTVETRDEASAVGVADPVVVESERGGGGSKEPVEVGMLPLARPAGSRRVARGVPVGVSVSGSMLSFCWASSSSLGE